MEYVFGDFVHVPDWYQCLSPCFRKLVSAILLLLYSHLSKKVVCEIYMPRGTLLCKKQEPDFIILYIYSYFEKGCRKKCTRQSRKVLWVVLRSLFFIAILKEWHERPWTLFPSAKGSSKSRFDSYSVRNSVLIISHITFRDCRMHIFSDNLSRNSCILYNNTAGCKRAFQSKTTI